MSYVLYHNPKCSKSRKVKEILDENQLDYTVVEYIKQGLSRSEVEELVKKLSLPLSAFIRTKEIEFKELNLDIGNDQSLLDGLIKCPKLLERPIVVHGDKAVIGRPPENVLAFIGK